MELSAAVTDSPIPPPPPDTGVGGPESVWQIGGRLTLTPHSWGRLGEAMAAYDGRPVFVFGGIPGEECEAEIVKFHRKYVAARVIRPLTPAPERVAPPCAYFGQCTGCQWQHLDYPAQLRIKRGKVVEALQRVGGIGNPAVDAVRPSPRPLGYRNHARLTVKRQDGREGVLGFVNRETRRFVRIDRCLLMHEGVNRLLAQLQDRCQETTQLSIRAAHTAAAPEDGSGASVPGDSANGPGALVEAGDYLIQPALHHPDITPATGQKRYRESVDGHSFLVSSPSFFQVNVEQAAAAAQAVREGLELNGGDTLLDAYAGVGAFAVLLAGAVKQVIAVEESAAAVEDARRNAAHLDNVEFIAGRTEEILPALPAAPEAVVLDPPRAGCQPPALQALIRMRTPRVAYVSCDPETLARDLKTLLAGGYRLLRVTPIDMFPQTHHIECVALLRWGGDDVDSAGLTLASASPRRRELMAALGMQFALSPADVDETPQPDESPEAMVRRLSADKAAKIAAGLTAGYVIGADSTVVHQGAAIGKPADDADARRMLRRLRGTTHQVCTGLTVVNAATGQTLTASMSSEITLRPFSDAELERSIASGVPLDKAGGYAIQDAILRPAVHWQGCYSNIVGLPLCRLLAMLAELGCPIPAEWPAAAAPHCGPGCPAADDAAPGNPAADDARPGDFVADDARPGHFVADDARPGHSVADDARPGHPVAGNARPGHSVADDARPGNPVADNPGPGMEGAV